MDHIWCAIAETVATFLVYGPALSGPFLLDDTYLPYGQSQFADAPLIAWMRGVRPLLMLTYWMDFQSSGAAPGEITWSTCFYICSMVA